MILGFDEVNTMSLNSVVSAERTHIAFFGLCNVGKSSIVNAITNQDLSIVSDEKGTTTDPVKKAMELLPLGPVVIIDTPGFDDVGLLGKKRVEKTEQILRKTDIAVLVVDSRVALSEQEQKWISLFKERDIPFLVIHNKVDLLSDKPSLESGHFYVSAKNGENIEQIKEILGTMKKVTEEPKTLLSDLISKDDLVILVIPIDEGAPKGRLILPQQQTIREILEAHCTAISCQDTELPKVLTLLKQQPAMVITDSQIFEKVSKIIPETIPLTSFSILFARYKGDLSQLLKGARKLADLKDGEQVLISEGCTHHRQCNDIGRVKIPHFIEEYSGAKLNFSFTSGNEFPSDVSGYSLIIHCGGCMLTEHEMQYRLGIAEKNHVPIVNYGIAIAQMKGILKRSVSLFSESL